MVEVPVGSGQDRPATPAALHPARVHLLGHRATHLLVEVAVSAFFA
jgi:hypothetical protein